MLPKIGIESFPSIPSNPGNDFFLGGGGNPVLIQIYQLPIVG